MLWKTQYLRFPVSLVFDYFELTHAVVPKSFGVLVGGLRRHEGLENIACFQVFRIIHQGSGPRLSVFGIEAGTQVQFFKASSRIGVVPYNKLALPHQAQCHGVIGPLKPGLFEVSYRFRILLLLIGS